MSVTREHVGRNSDVDNLGLEIPDRGNIIAAYLLMLPPILSVLASRPSRTLNPTSTGRVMSSNRSLRLPDLEANHLQMSSSLKAISERHLIYATGKSLQLPDFLSGTRKVVCDLPLCGNLTVNRSATLVSAGGSDLWKLWDLAEGRQVVQRTFQLLVVSRGATGAVTGNFNHLVVYDCEMQADACQVCLGKSVNHADFSRDNGLLALAMDDVEIQLLGIRCPTASFSLKGHLDHNFCVKFLTSSLLASGGQDLSTRVWDLRSPAAPLPAIAFGVGALDCSPEGKILLASETIG